MRITVKWVAVNADSLQAIGPAHRAAEFIKKEAPFIHPIAGQSLVKDLGCEELIWNGIFNGNVRLLLHWAELQILSFDTENPTSSSGERKRIFFYFLVSQTSWSKSFWHS